MLGAPGPPAAVAAVAWACHFGEARDRERDGRSAWILECGIPAGRLHYDRRPWVRLPWVRRPWVRVWRGPQGGNGPVRTDHGHSPVRACVCPTRGGYSRCLGNARTARVGGGRER